MVDSVLWDTFFGFFKDPNTKMLFLIALLIFSLIIIIYFIIKSKRLKITDPIESEEKTKALTPKSELENILGEMTEKATDESKPSYFEDEQEEKAIISYQELLAVHEGSEKPAESIEIMVDKTEDEVELQEEGDINLEKPKFKNSEVISPVFGRMDVSQKELATELEKVEQNTESEQHQDVESLDGEAFLNSLKQFRDSLD